MRKGFVCGLLTLLAIPVAFATQSKGEDLAPNLAKALTKAKVKSVVVFDFIGPDEKLNRLGQDLAEGLSQSLASSGGNFHVVDQAAVLAVIQKNRVTPDVVRLPEIAWWLARQLHADAVVTGKLSALGNELDVGVSAARIRDGKELDAFFSVVPLTEEMQKRLENSLTQDHTDDFAKLAANPASAPTCLRCLRPGYPEGATADKGRGTVLLAVLIDENGSPKQISILKPGPYGFNQAAIESVQKWMFNPANGLDGKPMAVWMQIELTFSLF
ncbi:MAG: TonB family protein [Candidatus Acidiferrales bacterium]